MSRDRGIPDIVKDLFADKKIDLFVGYENGTLPFRTTPCFVTGAERAGRLVWNSFCSNNLAVYLPRVLASRKEKTSRIGILCKGCDSRSVVGLIKEKQLKRDDIIIVGVACTGMVDSRKILAEVREIDIKEFREEGENIIVKYKDTSRIFRKNDCLYDCCSACTDPVPGVYDILFGEKKPQSPKPDGRTAEFKAKPRALRWTIFENEMSKCIRCYACRNACPNCYCKECFADQTKPKWLSVSTDLSDVIFYHMGRIFHQAGRCVDCGACSRACPMDVDLRLFTRMLVDEVKDLFGYDPGVNLDEAPPLTVFKPNDRQEFITEPSGGQE